MNSENGNLDNSDLSLQRRLIGKQLRKLLSTCVFMIAFFLEFLLSLFRSTAGSVYFVLLFVSEGIAAFFMIRFYDNLLRARESERVSAQLAAIKPTPQENSGVVKMTQETEESELPEQKSLPVIVNNDSSDIPADPYNAPGAGRHALGLMVSCFFMFLILTWFFNELFKSPINFSLLFGLLVIVFLLFLWARNSYPRIKHMTDLTKAKQQLVTLKTPALPKQSPVPKATVLQPQPAHSSANQFDNSAFIRQQQDWKSIRKPFYKLLAFSAASFIVIRIIIGLFDDYYTIAVIVIAVIVGIEQLFFKNILNSSWKQITGETYRGYMLFPTSRTWFRFDMPESSKSEDTVKLNPAETINLPSAVPQENKGEELLGSPEVLFQQATENNAMTQSSYEPTLNMRKTWKNMVIIIVLINLCFLFGVFLKWFQGNPFFYFVLWLACDLALTLFCVNVYIRTKDSE